MTVATQAERFAQVAYTSSRTGFGVHAAQGGPTPDEINHLVRGADAERTSFGEVLPAYASPDEVARFHRNLVARRLPGGALAVWHSAPAGTDESGRAGNVFVHVVLDRTPDRAGDRVIDTWRSPDWRTPYGAPEVRVSELPPEPPMPGVTVTRSAVCAFLTDPRLWRLGLLGRLLDELAHREPDSAPVVLAASSPDAAALWVGSVAHLMSPGSAASLGFSVWETERTLSSDRMDGIELLCIPLEEAADVRDRHPQLVIIREDEDYALLDWDPTLGAGPHAWGPLAVALFSIADDPEPLLAECDATAARVGDSGLARHWPLAITMAQHLDDWPYLSACIATALHNDTPSAIETWPDLLALTVDLVERQLGASTSAAWGAVQGVDGGSVSNVLRRIYLSRAMADREWLLRQDPVPGSADPSWNPSADPFLVHGVEEVTARWASEPDPLERAKLLVRLGDLLTRSGWLHGRGVEGLPGALTEVLERSLVPVLADRAATPLLDALQLTGVETRALVLRSVLADLPSVAARQPVTLGARVSPAVLQWLYAGYSLSRAVERTHLTRLDLEDVAWELRHGSAEVSDRRALALREVVQGRVTGEDARILVGRAAGRTPLAPAEVSSLIPTDALTPGVCRAALTSASVDARSDALALVDSLAVPGAGDRYLDRADARTMRLLFRAPAWGASDLEMFTSDCSGVTRTLTDLAEQSRTQLGSLWRGDLAVAHLVGRTEDPARVAAALAGADTSAPGLRDLLGAVFRLEAPDERTWSLVDRLLRTALVNDPAWPGSGHDRTSRTICALRDADDTPAVASALALLLRRVDKDTSIECRDVLVDHIREFADDRDLTAFAKDWYGQLTGMQGVGDRLRQVGGRFFAHRGED